MKVLCLVRIEKKVGSLGLTNVHYGLGMSQTLSRVFSTEGKTTQKKNQREVVNSLGLFCYLCESTHAQNYFNKDEILIRRHKINC